MPDLLNEAGILKVILHGYVNEEHKRCMVEAIDSLRRPFSDFADQALLPMEERPNFEKVPKLFLVIGPSQRVKTLKDEWDKKIRSFFDKLCEDDSVNKRVSRQLQKIRQVPSLDLLFLLFLTNLVDDNNVYFPRGMILDNDDVSMMVYYCTKDYNDNPQYAIQAIINLWTRRERPQLKGLQCLTRSFILGDNIIRRRILAMIPDPEEDNWCLLLEGGLVFPIIEDFEESVSKLNSSHLGRWTVGEVEDILHNPIYKYGYYFQPYELFLEWQYVFLYALATLDVNLFEVDQLEKIYIEFCNFIRSQICDCIDVNETIDNLSFIEVFIRHISELQAYLRGQEEPGVSKNVIFLMKSRFSFLPVVYQLLMKFYPVRDRLNKDKFDIRRWNELISKLTLELSAYDKGLILEDVATYFITRIDGLKITGKRERGKREEVNIYCCNVSIDSDLWKMGPLILIECKNRKQKCKVSDIRNLIPVMDSKGIKTAIVFSTFGFTSTAKEEIVHQYFCGKTIISIDMTDLNRIPEKFMPRRLLIEKVLKLEKTYEDDIRLAY